MKKYKDRSHKNEEDRGLSIKIIYLLYGIALLVTFVVVAMAQIGGAEYALSAEILWIVILVLLFAASVAVPFIVQKSRNSETKNRKERDK